MRSDNTVFASEKACVSYAAGGGTLVVDTPLLSCKRQLAGAGLTEPADANFVLGTANADDFSGLLTDGNDVVCGFGGNDAVTSTSLAYGDIFLGGDDNDSVSSVLGGTFVGGAGDDSSGDTIGTIYGGPGNDHVYILYDGTFSGGDGDDSAYEVWEDATYDGGAGNDSVDSFLSGTFNGGEGNDFVNVLYGLFNGGNGTDTVTEKAAGSCTDVEVGC